MHRQHSHSNAAYSNYHTNHNTSIYTNRHPCNCTRPSSSQRM